MDYIEISFLKTYCKNYCNYNCKIYCNNNFRSVIYLLNNRYKFSVQFIYFSLHILKRQYNLNQ